MKEGMPRAIVTLCVSTLSIILFVRLICLNKDENQKATDIFLTFYDKAKSTLGISKVEDVDL
jgi:hypothetical protein